MSNLPEFYPVAGPSNGFQNGSSSGYAQQNQYYYQSDGDDDVEAFDTYGEDTFGEDTFGEDTAAEYTFAEDTFDDDEDSEPDLSLTEFPSDPEDDAGQGAKQRQVARKKGKTAIPKPGKVAEGATYQPGKRKRVKRMAMDGNTRAAKRNKTAKTPAELAELKKLNGLVTGAWLQDNFEATVKYALEAVKFDPSIFQLHATLAEALIKLDRPDDAAGALLAGLHTTSEVENWWYTVDRLKAICPNTKATRKQLVFCYSHILGLVHDDKLARLERMRVYRDHGSWRRVKADCLALLSLDPNNLECIQTLIQVAPVLDRRLEEPETTLDAIEAFKLYIANHMHMDVPGNSYIDWNLILMFADLFVSAGQIEEAIRQLKRVSRWVIGRGDETYWDNIEDDREWDMEDEPRRIELDEFEMPTYSDLMYGPSLPIELRVRLGTLRVLLGPEHLNEAMNHLNILYPEETNEPDALHNYADLFMDAASTLKEAGLYQEALRFYEPLRVISESLKASYLFDLATCYEALHREDDVRKTILEMRQSKNTVKGRIALAKLYKAQNRLQEMWQLILELRRGGHIEQVREAGITTTRPEGLPLPDKPPPIRQPNRAPPRPKPWKRRTLKEAKEVDKAELIKDRVVKTLHEDLQQLEESLKDDPSIIGEWLSLASQMFAEFSGQRAISHRSRINNVRNQVNENGEDGVTKRFSWGQNRIPTYRSLDFDAWMTFLLRYALRFADIGDESGCKRVLKVAAAANNIWDNEEKQHDFRVITLHCAIKFNDENTVCRTMRWFLRHHPFSIEVFNLMSFSNRALHLTPEMFMCGPEQKWMLRQVKQMDYALLLQEGDEAARLKLFPVPPISTIPFHGDRHDPTLLNHYAHIMLAGSGPQPAINYYLRAYTMRPNDPQLLLSLAMAYLSNAIKRVSTNRHYQVQQGMAFLLRYYQLRKDTGSALMQQEAEFNMGMAYHILNLSHLAVGYFEKVMAMSTQVKKEGKAKGLSESQIEDFAPEAAMALQSIMVLNGDQEAADEITAEHLIL
ncbi:TPR-like protein [Microthyrium microscopicum]|uniref:TPR-like protein n=1 Tax=Microthyrium microscopicum TaxID=703497 RepID=A0A6A6U6D0_9PEZI|nr:TPR-like protein [Microthyrium microscopicum]